MTRTLFCAFGFALLFSFTAPAMAADSIDWNKTGTGDWADTGNWSTGREPTAGDIAIINNGGTATISGAASSDGVRLGSKSGDTSGTLQGTLILDGTAAQLDATSSMPPGGSVGVGTDTGKGTLTISNGAMLKTDSIQVGYTGGSGKVTVSTGSILDAGSLGMSGTTGIGYMGKGEVILQSGGKFLAKELNLGSGEGGDGTLTIDGAGSTLTVSESALPVVGIGIGGGKGTMILQNGGTATVGAFQLGAQSGNGALTIDGVGSKLTLNGLDSTWGKVAYIGVDSGKGEITLQNGGALDAGSLYIGVNGDGRATVDGAASELTASDFAWIGNIGGNGEATLKNGGTLTVDAGNGTVYLSDSSNGKATLNLGDGTGAAGLVNAAEVYGYGSDAATSTVNFNHTATADNPYYFTKDGTENGNSVTLSGNLNMVNTAGYTVLTGTNTYTGGTSVTGGLINFANGNNLGSGSITLDGGGLQWATGTTTDISGRLNALGASGLFVDAGVQGYVGKRGGVSGSLRVGWAF